MKNKHKSSHVKRIDIPMSETKKLEKHERVSVQVNNFVSLHRWFCINSREFVGYGKLNERKKYTKKQLLYWPIAWTKFMWLSYRSYDLPLRKSWS